MIKPTPKNQDGKFEASQKDKDCVILFTEYENKPIGAVFTEGQLMKVFVKNEGLPRNTVCLGKITEIKSEIGSAFLMLSGKQKCFIRLSELKEEYNLTHPGHPPKCGDNYLIKIIKEPSKGKLASGSTGFSEKERKKYANASSRTDFSILEEGTDYIDSTLSYAENLTDRVNKCGRVRILTDNEELHLKLLAKFALGEQTLIIEEIKLYQDSLVSLNVLYSLGSRISEALNRHVWLKSGADLYFDYTEACTVIDVNSSKSQAKSHPGEDPYLALNIEAAKEIVRQVSLRNLSGIILIDFINMKNPSDREKLYEYLKDSARDYDSFFHVVGLTKLGIMETTRQKTGQMLCELFK